MLAGMKSEQVAGFVSESMAGFIGIRILRSEDAVPYVLRSWKSLNTSMLTAMRLSSGDTR